MLHQILPLVFQEENNYVHSSVKEGHRHHSHSTDPTKVPPRHKNKTLTIVWDIDRTLIGIDAPSPGNSRFTYRPFAIQVLLMAQAPHVENIVWTAADKDHAMVFVADINKITGGRVVFDHVMSRGYETSVKKSSHHYDKAIAKLKRSDVLIIDDSVVVAETNSGNVISVTPFSPSDYSEPNDAELFYLGQVLYRWIQGYDFKGNKLLTMMRGDERKFHAINPAIGSRESLEKCL